MEIRIWGATRLCQNSRNLFESAGGTATPINGTILIEGGAGIAPFDFKLPWFVTMMGLCFGGGQLMLGIVALFLGMVVLSVFQWVERRSPQDREASIRIEVASDGPKDSEIISQLQASGLSLAKWSVVYLDEAQRRELAVLVHWRSRPMDTLPPGIIERLAHHAGVLGIEWGG